MCGNKSTNSSRRGSRCVNRFLDHRVGAFDVVLDLVYLLAEGYEPTLSHTGKEQPPAEQDPEEQ